MSDEYPYFHKWAAEFRSLCASRTGCVWADLCGEESPLLSYWMDKFSPSEAIQHYIRKHDLIEIQDRSAP